MNSVAEFLGQQFVPNRAKTETLAHAGLKVIAKLVLREIMAKTERFLSALMAVATFPVVITLGECDFSFQ